MTRDELIALINQRLLEDATRAVFQTKDEKLHGFLVAHLSRKEGDDASKVIVGGICIVDDRKPDRLGPISFDPMRMGNLLIGADCVAIDSTEEISEKVYDEVMELVARDKTVLALLTTEERHGIWRMYVGMHWHGSEILEIVPVKGDRSTTFKTVVTTIDRSP